MAERAPSADGLNAICKSAAEPVLAGTAVVSAVCTLAGAIVKSAAFGPVTSTVLKASGVFLLVLKTSTCALRTAPMLMAPCTVFCSASKFTPAAAPSPAAALSLYTNQAGPSIVEGGGICAAPPPPRPFRRHRRPRLWLTSGPYRSNSSRQRS